MRKKTPETLQNTNTTVLHTIDESLAFYAYTLYHLAVISQFEPLRARKMQKLFASVR